MESQAQERGKNFVLKGEQVSFLRELLMGGGEHGRREKRKKENLGFLREMRVSP